MQLFGSYLHSLCLEEIEDFSKDAWIWVKPPRLEGYRVIMSTIEDKGFAHKASTRKELLLGIKLLATFSALQTNKHVDPGAQQDSPLGEDVHQEPLVEDVQPNPLGEEHPTELQRVEVVMPSPHIIKAIPLRSHMPSVHSLTQKVLVLDMNGLLLRRYQYGERLPTCTCYVFKQVFKGGKDLGTNCLVRPDVCDFLEECGCIFELSIWSSCSNTNINFTLRRCLRGMHPHIWKEQLSQKECVKLPFKI